MWMERGAYYENAVTIVGAATVMGAVAAMVTVMLVIPALPHWRSGMAIPPGAA